MLTKRGWTDGITHTAKSFKNWNSCMADRPCKIIAIVGIVLASILGLWLIGSLLTCIRQGFTGIGGFLCWCCNSNNSSQQQLRNNQQYNPTPPNIVYQPVEHGYYNNIQGYNQEPQYYNENDNDNKNRNSVFELEEDFDLEGQRTKSKQSRGYFQQPYPN
ncbi:hypothetical protein C6P44_002674 [Monosporozyma unispora]|nr:hypothetical protein C6P44_002674 [Kazachstania unispora]